MTSSPHTTTITFSYRSERRATVIERSLACELGEIDGDRSETTLDRTGATLSVTITAQDLTALRAALNTWLSLGDVAERSIDVGRPAP
ncbi:KEOPS complex subunit Pcc1 [Halovivax gelatinilyticus]|uniref:KEOPS complex subunit Pcc1 n=1 Tax=Halovivax gelatinilyticus TaxID=2961597 RepID=UPI0020CA56CA|nr:KEOPS complex subunit Pcc1 [Halovivax gelatinilyticus]